MPCATAGQQPVVLTSCDEFAEAPVGAEEARTHNTLLAHVATQLAHGKRSSEHNLCECRSAARRADRHAERRSVFRQAAAVFVVALFTLALHLLSNARLGAGVNRNGPERRDVPLLSTVTHGRDQAEKPLVVPRSSVADLVFASSKPFPRRRCLCCTSRMRAPRETPRAPLLRANFKRLETWSGCASGVLGLEWVRDSSAKCTLWALFFVGWPRIFGPDWWQPVQQK